LPVSALQQSLRGAGLGLDFGLVRARLRSDVPGLAQKLQLLYAHFPVEPADGFFDITASLQWPAGTRRFVRPQVEFAVDGQLPFDPFPSDTDLPLLEWGLNWCISGRCHHVLLLHAGVVERAGRAILLPALPGSGKSTLTAALANRGWRFLADEFGALRLEDGVLLPVVRPSGLKNESIDVIRRFAPTAVLGPSFPKTHKGTIAHLAPDAPSVSARRQPAGPLAVVFPKFTPGAEVQLSEMPRGKAFAKLAANSFNYDVLGAKSFDALGRLISTTESYRLSYSNLDDAVAVLAKLHTNLLAHADSDNGLHTHAL